MLVEGLGVETDVERGVEYLCRASDAGSAQAHYELVRVTGNASWRAVHGELMTVNVAATTCGLGDFSDRVRNGSGRLGIRFPAYTFTTLAHHSHHPTRSPLTPPHSLSITLRKATLLYCGTDVEEDEEQVRSPLTHSNPHSHSLSTQTHTHTHTTPTLMRTWHRSTLVQAFDLFLLAAEQVPRPHSQTNHYSPTLW